MRVIAIEESWTLTAPPRLKERAYVLGAQVDAAELRALLDDGWVLLMRRAR